MSYFGPSDALDYLTNTYGWSRTQAAGIIGNLSFESGGWNPRAVGDSGSAYGLAQWHPDRQSTFEQIMGTSIRGSSAQQQLDFVNWELNHTESKAGNALRSQSTVQGATQAFMSGFERPASGSSLGSRTKAAINALGKTVGSQIGSNAKEIAGHLLQDGANLLLPGSGEVLGALGLTGNTCGIICQLKNWITKSGFFQRLSLAILAFIIIFAAFMLMKGLTINQIGGKLKEGIST